MNSSKFTYTDMLTLRPEWDLAASVPRPKGANLPHGLPLWNKKPLNSKLPLLAGPSGPIVFTRGKLGEQEKYYLLLVWNTERRSSRAAILIHSEYGGLRRAPCTLPAHRMTSDFGSGSILHRSLAHDPNISLV
ncbi:hypothetical protein J6590_020491 [Homalodisca vitripennis]|nr:hypothetical protein J6590_020491 [Homalodisca vitripennis]